MNPITEELRHLTRTDTGAERLADDTIAECLRAVMHHAAPTNPPPVGAIPPIDLPSEVPGRALPAAGMITLHLCRALRGLTHVDAVNTDLPARYAAWAVLEAIRSGGDVEPPTGHADLVERLLTDQYPILLLAHVAPLRAAQLARHLDTSTGATRQGWARAAAREQLAAENRAEVTR